MKLVLDTGDIAKMNLFQNLTGAHVLYTLDTDSIVYFIVGEGEHGLTVGRDGTKIKRVEKIFRKKIKIFENSPDLKTFIRNLVPESTEVELTGHEKDKKVRITVNRADKAKIIGKNGSNIKVIKDILHSMFDIKDIKVV